MKTYYPPHATSVEVVRSSVTGSSPSVLIAGKPASLASRRVILSVRDDFSSVLERLDGVDQTLSTLTQLTQQIAARTFAHEPSSKPGPCTPSNIQPTERSSSSSQNVQNAILPSAQNNYMAT
ncbi:hypothetical protein F4776DRAFT_668136 [Hypoxylon sp. NC0597]|nr:hypothetical protein F4776DRAFT_668136 [Hypoxylon sp. NC0597]